MTLTKYNAAGEMLTDEARFAPTGVVCSVHLTAATSAQAGLRKVPYNAIRFDPYAFFDLINSRFQPKIPGYYRLSALVDFAGNPSGSASFHWYRNGAFYTYGGYLYPAPTSESMLADSVVMYLNGTTDYAEVWVNVSNAIPIGGGANPSTRFDANLVAASVGVAPEPWHQVGAAGEPAFQSGWVNFDTVRVARFYRNPDGVVRLDGYIKTGTMVATAFTLPVSYRPMVDLDLPTQANSAFGMVRVLASGVVQPNVGNNIAFSLSGVAFRAEQ